MPAARPESSPMLPAGEPAESGVSWGAEDPAEKAPKAFFLLDPGFRGGITTARCRTPTTTTTVDTGVACTLHPLRGAGGQR